MPIHERDVAPPVMTQMRAAPVRIALRTHAAGAWRVVGRIVHDPASRFFRRLRGDTLHGVFGVRRSRAAVREMNGRGGDFVRGVPVPEPDPLIPRAAPLTA